MGVAEFFNRAKEENIPYDICDDPQNGRIYVMTDERNSRFFPDLLKGTFRVAGLIVFGLPRAMKRLASRNKPTRYED